MWREKAFIYERHNRNPKHKIADVKNKKSEKFQSVSAKCLMIEVHKKILPSIS